MITTALINQCELQLFKKNKSQVKKIGGIFMSEHLNAGFDDQTQVIAQRDVNDSQSIDLRMESHCVCRH